MEDKEHKSTQLFYSYGKEPLKPLVELETDTIELIKESFSDKAEDLTDWHPMSKSLSFNFEIKAHNLMRIKRLFKRPRAPRKKKKAMKAWVARLYDTKPKYITYSKSGHFVYEYQKCKSVLLMANKTTCPNFENKTYNQLTETHK